MAFVGLVPSEHSSGDKRGRARSRRSENDVGSAAAYLLSDDTANVTGTTLYVDAGYHAMGM